MYGLSPIQSKPGDLMKRSLVVGSLILLGTFVGSGRLVAQSTIEKTGKKVESGAKQTGDATVKGAKKVGNVTADKNKEAGKVTADKSKEVVKVTAEKSNEAVQQVGK